LSHKKELCGAAKSAWPYKPRPIWPKRKSVTVYNFRLEYQW